MIYVQHSTIKMPFSRVYFNLMHGAVHILFGTEALGMGIDVQDVNIVIYNVAQGSLEDYFQ